MTTGVPAPVTIVPAATSLAPIGTDPSLTDLTDAALLRLWSASMGELRRRGLIRSANNPTADYAEWFVANYLGLNLARQSMAGYDALGPDGLRYQIKARRLAAPKTSRQLSAIRNLDSDDFDYLVVVLFGPGFEVSEMWSLPLELVKEHAVYRSHVNAHILHAQGKILADPRAMRLV